MQADCGGRSQTPHHTHHGLTICTNAMPQQNLVTLYKVQAPNVANINQGVLTQASGLLVAAAMETNSWVLCRGQHPERLRRVQAQRWSISRWQQDDNNNISTYVLPVLPHSVRSPHICLSNCMYNVHLPRHASLQSNPVSACQPTPSKGTLHQLGCHPPFTLHSLPGHARMNAPASTQREDLNWQSRPPNIRYAAHTNKP